MSAGNASLAPEAVQPDDPDEDLIACRICLISFDEQGRLPKYMVGCHHYFCMSCIQDMLGSRGRKIYCPTCRAPTSLTRLKVEDLATNHVALRLLAVSIESRTKTLELEAKIESDKKKKKWCFTCVGVSNINCDLQKHNIQDAQEVKTSLDLMLLSRINQVRQSTDSALRNCRHLRQVHHTVLEWINWLQQEIKRRDLSNSEAIERLQSLAAACEASDVIEEEDLVSTLHRLESKIKTFGEKCETAQDLKAKAEQLLNAYNRAQDKAAHYSKPVDDVLTYWINELNDLGDNTEKGYQPCLSVLSFLVSVLSQGLPKLKDEKGGDKPAPAKVSEPVASCSGEGSQQVKRAVCAKEENLPAQKRIREEPQPSTSSAPPRPCPPQSKKLANRAASAVDCPPSTSAIPVAPRSTSNPRSRAFIEVQIPGLALKRVTFELNHSLATVMATKFLEYCVGAYHPGYLGSSLFQSLPQPAEEVTRLNPLDRIPSLVGGQIIDYLDQLFVADFSPLPPKRGSLCFVVKENNNWGTIVSPEFQILLNDVDKAFEKNITTVFGEVVEGFEVVDFLGSPAATAYFPVAITSCGMV